MNDHGATDHGTAIVTGAASGIGLATAKRFADQGYFVLAFDRDGPASASRSGAQAIPGQIEARQVDVRDVDGLQRAVRDGLVDRPPLRAVCSAAGIRAPKPLSELTAEGWDEIVEVNVRGSVFLVQACLPYLLEARGSVVLIGSPSAVADVADLAYCASKSALTAVARSLALLHAPDGVRFNVVSPSFTTSGMTSRAPAHRRFAAARRNAAGRVNEPDDIAGAVVWLSGPEAATLSGTVLDVGGVSGMPAQGRLQLSSSNDEPGAS